MDRVYYSVLNRTRATLLARRAEAACSPAARMKGLMGRPLEKFPSGSGLWIFPSNGIHTFGMRFPIDAVYLDSRRRVVRIYKRLVPKRIAALSVRTRSVLELPAGTLEAARTQVGDELEFRPLTTEETAGNKERA